jgi:shikimate kinase
MNLQENISRVKGLMGLITEQVTNYSGNKRIILIGPPTVGKSTIATELSNQLGIEYVRLDKLQQDYGYGEGKELELVRNVLSNNFEKYDTPSILDFGGGHVYNEGINELLKNYPNIFLLMPSTDTEKSNELLRKANEERWTEFMDQIIQGLKSGKHKHTEEKKTELISKLERMKQGEGGKFDKEDLPDTPEMQGWGGLDMEKDWNKFVPLSSNEDQINRSVAKHVVPVYDESGNRRNKSDIAGDIISQLT